MSDPMENLNNAADALNQVAQRAGSFWDDADAEIATRQAAYDGLAANLEGVVKSQMFFSGTVDPDDPAPTNVDGGTFNSIKALVDAAPAGAYVRVLLLAGQTYLINANIYLHAQHVFLEKIGTGDDPVVSFGSWTSSTHNFVFGFRALGGASVMVRNLNIELPASKPDPALPWAANNTLVEYTAAQGQHLSVLHCTISGSSEVGLIRSTPGGGASLMLDTVTLDGCVAVTNAGLGITMISHRVLTLQNGAVLESGGVLGTNMLIGG